MTDLAVAQMWARTPTGDQSWQDEISTLDESTLRMLIAQIRVQQRTLIRRQQFVQMLLDLAPAHACDCNKRWTSTLMPHQESCDLLKACTCERRWTGGGLSLLEHSPECELSHWVINPEFNQK